MKTIAQYASDSYRWSTLALILVAFVAAVGVAGAKDEASSVAGPKNLSEKKANGQSFLAKDKSSLPETGAEIVVAFSSNNGHGWSGNVPYYKPYVIDPLEKKYGDRIIFLVEKATPENIRKMVADERVKMFVWIGGGLADQIECNDQEMHECPKWRPGFDRNAPELKGKIAFINSEFSHNYLKTLPVRAGFGYWTEMSTEMHDKKYNCDYFYDAVQPIDWYAPYFILMQRVIGWMAEGYTVQETAQRANQYWSGFLAWVEAHRSQVPFAYDYLDIGRQMFGDLTESIIGNQNGGIKSAGEKAADHETSPIIRNDNAPDTTNTLLNPGFEENVEKETPTGWTMENGTAKVGLDRQTRHGGKAALRVGGAGFCNIIHVVDIKDLPKGEELVLTGFVKIKGDPSKNFANLWLQFQMPGNKTSRVECDGISGSVDWKEFKTHMIVPKDCEQSMVGLYYFSKDNSATVWFDDLALRKPQSGEKLERTFASQQMEGPGLACAEGGYEFSGEASAKGIKIAFPIPQMYEEQVPFYIEFITRPEGAIQKCTLKKRLEAPPNWLAEVEFKPLKGKKIEFGWKGYVLLGIHDYDALPKAVKIVPEQDLPPEVRPWLKATKSVQSDDPAIKKKAQELRALDADCIQTIRNALKCSSETVQNEIKPDKPDTTAAETFEHGGGECTSAANLAAALLRAAGIPARILANYPNWNTPFQTHYFVEAYVPGSGWARGESIMNRFPVQSYENVIVSVVYPQDENDSFRTENLVEGSGAAGCPWLSMTEPLTTNSSFILPWKNCDHVAAPVVEYKSTKSELDPVLELTRKVWNAYLEHAVSEKPVNEALEFQKKACLANNLEEFKYLMQKAYDSYKIQR